MNINGFELQNPVKIDRAREKLGPDADDTVLLAEYDRLGGFITKAGQKLKSGCFYDVKRKAARAKPELIYVYAVNGRTVEVPEGTELPGEVRAAKMVEEAEKVARTGKAETKAKAKKKADEVKDAEDEGDDE